MSKTVGYAYVCGDILHIGHIRHLRNCKAMVDTLIVGVLTDEAVMEKKPQPVIPFSERMEMVDECKSVDMVVAQEQYSPLKNIIAIKPDVVFESVSHDSPVHNPFGRMIQMPYYPTQSSTNIKEKIKNVDQ